MRPAHELWQAARQELLPAAASREQERELRRVFYVGMLCLHQLQQGFADLPPDDRAGLDRALQTELAIFRATVGTPLEGKV
jgi:hypothetical protein